MALPRALLPTPRQQFFKVTAAGVQPLVGSVGFFLAGTSTPVAVFANAQGATELGTVVDMDDSGTLPAVYVPPVGIKVVIYPGPAGGGLPIYTQDNVTDPGTVFLAQLGTFLAEGARDVGSGYEIDPSDNFVTVNEPVTDPALIILQNGADRTQPLTVKNLGPTQVALVPKFGEAIDGVIANYILPVAASPNFPTITVLPIVGGYLIASSHAL